MKLTITSISFILIAFLLISSDAWRRRRRRRRRCDTSPCVWAWGKCSKTCGGGTQSPQITRQKGACGSCSLPKARSCNSGCCPVNCVWGSWGGYGSCSATCGSGSQKRTRTNAVSASCSGKSCSGSSTDTRPCNTECCPINFDWGAWSDYEPCSVTCGAGTQSRSRSPAVTVSCGSPTCSIFATESRDCNIQCCPIDCILNNWGEWSVCTKTCGKGEQRRERTINSNEVCGGESCKGKTSETRSCNDACCPSPCIWSEWSEWDECSLSCGGGVQIRRRNVTQYESCQGESCLGPAAEEQLCNKNCCPVDCKVGSWSEWNECSTTCGAQGLQTRRREVITKDQCNGIACPRETEETRPCNRVCHNGATMDAISCSCRLGWTGECCENDINECINPPGPFPVCHLNATCTNLNGSYVCECEKGFEGDGYQQCKDINECELNQHDCRGESVTCLNTVGSYTCDCGDYVYRNGECGERIPDGEEP